MRARIERGYVGCGLVGLLIVLAGTVIGHLLPPPSPSESGQQVVAFYRAHVDALRWGSVLICFGTAMLGPWIGVAVRKMSRIEGLGMAGVYCQLALGALLIIEIIFPMLLLQVLLFRLDRPVSQTLDLSDLFLITFLSPAYTLIVEILLSAFAIARDRSADPVFPRWVAAAGVLGAILSIPAVIVVFVKTGPLRWSGPIGFWVPFVGFGIWFIAMTIPMLRREDDGQSA